MREGGGPPPWATVCLGFLAGDRRSCRRAKHVVWGLRLLFAPMMENMSEGTNSELQILEGFVQDVIIVERAGGWPRFGHWFFGLCLLNG